MKSLQHVFSQNLKSDSPKASLFYISDGLTVLGCAIFCASTVLLHRGINQIKPEVSDTSVDNETGLAPLLPEQTPQKICCNAQRLTWLASGINSIATAGYLAWFISQSIIFIYNDSNPDEVFEATIASLPAYALLLLTSMVVFKVAHDRKLTEPNENNRSISQSIARLEEPEQSRSESKRVPGNQHRITGTSEATHFGSINGGDDSAQSLPSTSIPAFLSGSV